MRLSQHTGQPGRAAVNQPRLHLPASGLACEDHRPALGDEVRGQGRAEHRAGRLRSPPFDARMFEAKMTCSISAETRASDCYHVGRQSLLPKMFRWRKPGDSSAEQRSHEPSGPLRCSFCNKTAEDVGKLIAGPTVYICDECVDVCVDIIADDPSFQALSRDSAGAKHPHTTARALAQIGATCSLCGKSALLDQVLPIESRGVLCGECADAVEDALAQGRPSS
jgi:hypothetical protein